VLVVLALTLVGTRSDGTASGGSSHDYPEAVEKTFVTSCVDGGGTRTQCQCALGVVERMYARDEFVELSYEVQRTGTYPPDLMSTIATECS
jgi:hypothetical protein